MNVTINRNTQSIVAVQLQQMKRFVPKDGPYTSHCSYFTGLDDLETAVLNTELPRCILKAM